MEKAASYIQNSAQHVIPNFDGLWVVKRSGSVKATKKFRTKAEAIRYARNLGKITPTVIFIHDKDGKVIKVEKS